MQRIRELLKSYCTWFLCLGVVQPSSFTGPRLTWHCWMRIGTLPCTWLAARCVLLIHKVLKSLWCGGYQRHARKKNCDFLSFGDIFPSEARTTVTCFVPQAHEMCALLILGEIHSPTLINATNSALQMWEQSIIFERREQFYRILWFCMF